MRESELFIKDTATTEIYTLTLHDALPVCQRRPSSSAGSASPVASSMARTALTGSGLPGSSTSTVASASRSEEHTSELQSRQYLVCRLLLAKKNSPSFP